jgi:hypothetical protein
MPSTAQLDVHVRIIPSIVQLRYSFWRHPILWWKTRHLLPDILALEARISNELLAAFREREDQAFLRGDG